ncbi:helix-turn-helix domain-containing protein [Castellaniella caeni]|uniref:helix-turn-helix domain-containing protein n=1 Tax=Castellaniella caeni TaxID=266123 RepID=UPI0011AED2BD|nr:helix-turn-helix transcriptional regulator [Castellaniella caeni]
MEELDLEAVGDRIRSVRGMLRQIDFANRLGVERKTIGRYEAGERPPDAEVLLRLSKEFGADPIWILTGQGSNRATSPDLTPKEQVILDAYRTGTAEQQDFILKAALGFSGTSDVSGRSKARVRQKQTVKDNHGFLIMSGNTTHDEKEKK